MIPHNHPSHAHTINWSTNQTQSNGQLHQLSTSQRVFCFIYLDFIGQLHQLSKSHQVTLIHLLRLYHVQATNWHQLSRFDLTGAIKPIAPDCPTNFDQLYSINPNPTLHLLCISCMTSGYSLACCFFIFTPFSPILSSLVLISSILPPLHFSFFFERSPDFSKKFGPSLEGAYHPLNLHFMGHFFTPIFLSLKRRDKPHRLKEGQM